tara:strand:+ start:123 stop:932 length:810 start_codon:yes stop_codon:yes gene_type:complete
VLQSYANDPKFHVLGESMLDITSLLPKIGSGRNRLKFVEGDLIDSFGNNVAFVVETGALLAYDDRNLTQTFVSSDPIGFAEIVAGRDITLKFRAKSDGQLIEFDGDEIKASAVNADPVCSSIIKYSVARVFGSDRKQKNYKFEDYFLNDNIKKFKHLNYEKEAPIFTQGDEGHGMFYVEQGLVRLETKSAQVLAELGPGECFGEAALFDTEGRMCSAFASSNTSLVFIEKELMLAEIQKAPLMTQFMVVTLLKRLDLMNKLRWANDFKD